MTEDIVRLLARLEGSAEMTPDSTTIRHHGDRKELSKEREKKIAMSHRADDHEDGPKMA